MTTKHTPTPWKSQAIRKAGREPVFAIGHQVTGQIATVINGQETDAAFIVRAVNAHDALVAALRDITDALAAQLATEGARLYGDPGTHNFVTRARAVLAGVQS